MVSGVDGEHGRIAPRNVATALRVKSVPAQIQRLILAALHVLEMAQKNKFATRDCVGVSFDSS